MTTETLLPISVRLTGRPRRLQPAICSVDLLRFIFRAPSVETDPANGVTFLPLEAARKVLEALLRHPEGQAYNPEACQRLLVWLRGYPQVRQHAWLN